MGTGRRIALVEFYRSSDAEGFLRRHGSSISFPLEHSRGADSKTLTFDIDFAERDDREERDDVDKRDRGHDDMYDDGWKCPNVSLYPGYRAHPVTKQLQCDGVNYPSRFACYRCRTERPGESAIL
jgi:hypothetical protein